MALDEDGGFGKLMLAFIAAVVLMIERSMTSASDHDDDRHRI